VAKFEKAKRDDAEMSDDARENYEGNEIGEGLRTGNMPA
jgi:hypothetical protein